ncbi:MAG: hypothetical protein ACJA08_000204 [Cyclobacteriaceae bacterium]|jgi:hypothetical protein
MLKVNFLAIIFKNGKINKIFPLLLGKWRWEFGGLAGKLVKR